MLNIDAIRGKTLSNLSVQHDSLGAHLRLSFSDGAQAEVSFLWPESQKLDVDAAFFRNKDADGEPLKIKEVRE